MVKKVGIIQARLSSSRLPGKILKDLCGKTLLERVYDRAILSNSLDEVWVATSTDETDDIVELFCKEKGILYHRGDLDNVLNRFCEVIERSKADLVVRITADNPLTEPSFIKNGIKTLIDHEVDYVSFKNIPYGSGVEIIRSKALLLAQHLTDSEFDCEHVTPFINTNPGKFNIMMIKPEKTLPNIRVTVDTLEDYIKMYKLFYLLNKKQINEHAYLEKAIEWDRETHSLLP